MITKKLWADFHESWGLGRTWTGEVLI